MNIVADRKGNRQRDGPTLTDSRTMLSVMRIADPQISFADAELLRQGVQLDPLLRKISDFIDQHEELVELVRRDLERGLKKPKTGRRGLTPNQVLRSLILMRIKNWDYRELCERIRDGYTLRNFTGFYSQPVPKHNAFNQAFNRLTPAMVEKINDAVIQAAVTDGLEEHRRFKPEHKRFKRGAASIWGVVRCHSGVPECRIRGILSGRQRTEARIGCRLARRPV